MWRQGIRRNLYGSKKLRIFWTRITVRRFLQADRINIKYSKGKGVTMREHTLNKRLNRIKWISMVIVALAFFFVQFHRNTPGVMRDELTAAFGMSSTTFGLFSSMYFYPYMIAQIPVGMLLDSLGVRKTIGISSLIAAVGAFVFGTAGVYPVACVGRILIGIGVAAPVISTQKFLVSWVGSAKSASYYGVFSFMGKLGGMVAQLPLAWLVSRFNWRTVFFICASISVAIALLCMLLTMFLSDWRKGRPLAWLASPAAASPPWAGQFCACTLIPAVKCFSEAEIFWRSAKRICCLCGVRCK